MKDFTLEELLPLYARARQKVRNQRNELRALNKSIKWEQLNRRLQYNEIDRFRRLWNDERMKKMPPAAQVQQRSIWPPLLVGSIIGIILAHLFIVAIR